jgi:hypothetical protein
MYLLIEFSYFKQLFEFISGKKEQKYCPLYPFNLNDYHSALNNINRL